MSAVLALACGVFGWQWRTASDLDARLADAARTAVPEGAVLAAAGGDDAGVRVLIAQATRLRAQGREDETVRILQALAARADVIGEAALSARQNLGNALLVLALRSNAQGDEDRAMTLVELAKQRYREVLRDTPHAWDARHNLDVALRLAPEVEAPPAAEKPTNVQRIQVDLRGLRGVDLP